MGSVALSFLVESNSFRPHKPTNDGLLERPDINESLGVRGECNNKVVVSTEPITWTSHEYGLFVVKLKLTKSGQKSSWVIDII